MVEMVFSGLPLLSGGLLGEVGDEDEDEEEETGVVSLLEFDLGT